MSYLLATGKTKWNSVAGELIPRLTWVRVTTTGLFVASSDTDEYVDGLALSTTNLGEQVTVTSEGQIKQLDWTDAIGSVHLTPGNRYFVLSNGKMSDTPPNTGFILQVGHAQTDKEFLINIQQSIRL